jgi:hypothetical protein
MVAAAARWSGLLQRAVDRAANDEALAFMIRYDLDYYRSWASRTLSFAGHRRSAMPWLEPFCDWYRDACERLYGGGVTTIHGEYTPKNILAVTEGHIYPVDWETAALAVGEIDLAALTEGWDTVTTRIAEEHYAAARWGATKPREFHRRLDAARLYWRLRWLGDRPEWTQHDEIDHLWGRVLDVARNLGFEDRG